MQKTKGQTELRIKAIQNQIKRHLTILNTLHTRALKSKTDPKRFLKALEASSKTRDKINLLFDKYKSLLEERARKEVAELWTDFLREIEKKFG